MFAGSVHNQPTSYDKFDWMTKLYPNKVRIRLMHNMN